MTEDEAGVAAAAGVSVSPLTPVLLSLYLLFISLSLSSFFLLPIPFSLSLCPYLSFVYLISSPDNAVTIDLCHM